VAAPARTPSAEPTAVARPRSPHYCTVIGMALAMLTNPYLTDKVIALDGGLHPA